MGSENSLQYVKFDYTSHRDALLQRVRSRWSTSWNDFLANSFGRVLVDLVAWSTANTAFLLNRLAAENFLPTMTLRESAVRLGQLFSYKLRNPSAASVSCDAVLNGTVSSGEIVTIAKGTAVSAETDAGNLIFELTQDYTIAEGKTSPEKLILRVASNATGADALRSTFIATAGSTNFDLADSTLDLNEFVSAGQSIRQIGSNTVYRISEVTSSSTSSSNNRLILDRPWETASGTVEVDIVEQRVLLIEGQTFNETYTAPQVETPALTIRLTRTPVIEDSVIVTVNGTVWKQGYLALADQGDQIVEVKHTVDKATVLVFGDGVLGSIPPTESTIEVQYRVGGGVAGNVEIGAINATVVGTKTGLATTQVQIQVTNSTAQGQGGTDYETLNEARSSLPRFIRANDRGVTASDYEILASRYSHPTYGQVRYARVVTKSENSLLEGNIVTIYAWTTGSAGSLTKLSTGLKQALKSYLETKVVGTDYVVINDGIERPAPICLRFKVFTGYSVSSVKAVVESAISSVVNSGTPGQPVVYSNLIHELDVIQGVDSVTMASPTSDLETSSANEIFTPPNSAYDYEVPLVVSDNYTYTGQSPVAPLQAWSFRAYLEGTELLVVPDSIPGRARLVGGGIASYDVGLIADRPTAVTENENGFYFATDVGTTYRSNGTDWIEVPIGGSYINLLTGQVVLSTTGITGDLKIRLITTQGYDSERSINLYVGYTGDNTQAKRREIRAALRSWSNGFKIGGSMFAAAQRNQAGEVTLDTSRSNVTDVVLSVPGITGVNKVSMDSPSNSLNRIDASSTELLKVGSISINGFVD